jgi:CHAT domain-containing protein
VRVDLAQLADTAGTDNRKLLDAAEQDARAAITTIGEGVRGVHAGRRWWQLGQVLMAREQYTPHLVATIRRALEDLSPESAPYDCREAARRLGGMAANAGDWPVAAEAWEQAVFAAIAAVDARATPDGRFAEVVENLNICRWAAYALTRAGNPRRAIEVLELGRARELATWLRRDVVDLQEVRELDAQLCGRFLDLERRVAASARAGMAADDVAAAHIAEELSRTIEEIRQLSGLDSFLKPPSLEQTVSGMTIADSIAYPLTAQGAAWLILRKGVDGGPEIEVVDVPGVTSLTTLAALAPPGEAGDGVGGFLTALNSDDVDAIDIAIANAAPHLGPALLKPLADALAARGCTSVCVVPIGLLALVPLHALSWDDGGGQRCLLDEFDVKYAPSAYVHAVCRTRANRPPSFDKLLAVGNPMPQAQPLPGAEREARLVHAIVPAKQKVLLHGTAATKDAVLAALPAASHAHLACHGRAAMNDPRGFDAALWFAADSPASAAEILDLDLSQVRLIVTSACETAVVPSYAGADEALSLSSIFLGAGAAGVVASLWSVDDYATSFLMVRFYEELVASPANPAHALRFAQLWLRDLNAEEEARYASRHAALRVEHARRYAAHEPGRGRRAEQRSMPTWQTSRNPFARPSMWAAFAFCGV